jgi:hypothetical protein
MEPADQDRCDADPMLRMLDSGELGDGRLVFHESAKSAFNVSSGGNVNRNVRFVDDLQTVNHFVEAHAVGGAKVLMGGPIEPDPQKSAPS